MITKYKYVIYVLITFAFTSTCYSQDLCNVSAATNAEQAIQAQTCIKKVIEEMKLLLGTNEEVIKQHLAFIGASAASSNQCLIAERNYLNKKNGLPFNPFYTEEQLKECDKTTKAIAIALTNTADEFVNIKKRAKLSEDAIQAFELKYSQISAAIAAYGLKK